jgi:aminopeptidase N
LSKELCSFNLGMGVGHPGIPSSTRVQGCIPAVSYNPEHAKNEALLFGADAVHPQVPRPKPGFLAPKSAMLGKKRCLPSGFSDKPIFKVARQGALIPEVVASESSSDGPAGKRKGTLRSSLVKRAKRYKKKNESLRSKSAELEAELQRAKERVKQQDI